MPRFFVAPNMISGNRVVFRGDDANHISRSLRMAVGDTIIVCDGTGAEYPAELVAFTADSVTAVLGDPRESRSELPVAVRLYQAYPKGDKLEWIIQKTVELGVSSIVPFDSKNCVKRPPAERMDKMTARLSRISEEAAKQSGRAKIPEILSPLSFHEMLADATAYGDAFICYENERTVSLRDILRGFSGNHLALIIGSEGGFTPEEIAEAEAAGVASVSLGHRILRCETAAMFALSACVYAWDL